MLHGLVGFSCVGREGGWCWSFGFRVSDAGFVCCAFVARLFQVFKVLGCKVRVGDCQGGEGCGAQGFPAEGFCWP